MTIVKNKSSLNKNPAALKKLYRLVESMTAAQKRAFKRDAKFWGEKENGLYYIALFDAVNNFCAKEEKKESDLAKFVEQNTSAAVRSSLTSKSSYLYEKILESMRFVSSGSRTFKELNGLMQDIHFLYNKNLLEDCLRKISEARELALEIDQPGYLIELNILEHRISQTINKDRTNHKFSDIGENNKETLRLIQRQAELISLSDTLRRHSVSKKVILDKQIRQLAEQLLSEYQSGTKYDSPRLEYQIVTACTNFYRYKFATGEISNEVFSFEVGKLQMRVVELMKTHASFREDQYPIFQFVMTNYLISLLFKGEFALVKEELAELEKTEDELFRCRTLAYVSLQLMIQERRLNDGYEYLTKHKIAKNLLTYNEQIWQSRLLTMWYLSGYICLGVSAHKELLTFSQRLMEDIQSTERLDLRYCGFFLNAIAKFELKKGDQVQCFDIIKKLFRHIEKRKTSIVEVEMECLIQLRKMFAAFWLKPRTKKSDEENIAKAEQLKIVCDSNTNTSCYAMLFCWLLSKLKNTPIQDELK